MNLVRPYLRWANTCVLAVATAGLTACVTINIYFPAAAAEKAADKVIDEIWQMPAGDSPANNTPASVPSPIPASKEDNVPAVTPAINQEPAP